LTSIRSRGWRPPGAERVHGGSRGFSQKE